MWDLVSAVPCLSLKFPLVYVSNLALAVLSSSASRMVPRSANYLPMNNPGGTTRLCSHEALSFPLDYAKDMYASFEHADVPLLASLFVGKLRVKESFSKSISVARWEAGPSFCAFALICIWKCVSWLVDLFWIDFKRQNHLETRQWTSNHGKIWFTFANIPFPSKPLLPRLIQNQS